MYVCKHVCRKYTVIVALQIERLSLPLLYWLVSCEERTNFEIDAPSAPPPDGAGLWQIFKVGKFLDVRRFPIASIAIDLSMHLALAIPFPTPGPARQNGNCSISWLRPSEVLTASI